MGLMLAFLVVCAAGVLGFAFGWQQGHAAGAEAYRDGLLTERRILLAKLRDTTPVDYRCCECNLVWSTSGFPMHCPRGHRDIEALTSQAERQAAWANAHRKLTAEVPGETRP